jgi:hypothetical protein
MRDYKSKLSNELIKELLESFLIYHELMNKIPLEKLGFIQRKMFLGQQKKVNELKEKIDKC